MGTVINRLRLLMNGDGARLSKYADVQRVRAIFSLSRVSHEDVSCM